MEHQMDSYLNEVDERNALDDAELAESTAYPFMSTEEADAYETAMNGPIKPMMETVDDLGSTLARMRQTMIELGMLDESEAV
jgi:hypothetical protein